MLPTLIREIPHLAPHYGCDAQGNVYRLTHRGSDRPRKIPRQLNPAANIKSGYRIFIAYQGSRSQRTFEYVHQCVAETWIGPRGPEIHHRDGDKDNNAVDNLAYVNRSEHSLIHISESHRRGCVVQKFDDSVIRAILRDRRTMTCAAVATKHGCSAGYASKLAHGIYRRAITASK